jgi:hypothetical protein
MYRYRTPTPPTSQQAVVMPGIPIVEMHLPDGTATITMNKVTDRAE